MTKGCELVFQNDLQLVVRTRDRTEKRQQLTISLGDRVLLPSHSRELILQVSTCVAVTATHYQECCQPRGQGSTPLSLQGINPSGKHMLEARVDHFQPGRQGSTSLSLHGNDPAVKHMVEVIAAQFQPGRQGSVSRFQEKEKSGEMITINDNIKW